MRDFVQFAYLANGKFLLVICMKYGKDENKAVCAVRNKDRWQNWVGVLARCAFYPGYGKVMCCYRVFFERNHHSWIFRKLTALTVRLAVRALETEQVKDFHGFIENIYIAFKLIFRKTLEKYFIFSYHDVVFNDTQRRWPFCYQALGLSSLFIISF